MKKLLQLIVVFLFSYLPINAQSYIGHSVDNYSGIHAVLLNPSSVVDSRLRADINIFSTSAFLGSDYFAINFSALADSEDGFNLDSDLEKDPKDNNQFFLNLDALGPSFMFNLSPKHSIGITTRVRTFLNLNNISGELYEDLEDGFDEEEDFDFEMNSFSGTIHAWGELGVTYGRILMEKDRHFLKGGLTLKYLVGAGGVFTSTPSLTGNYDANNTNLTTTGSLNYGMTMDFDSENIDFSNTTSGFGGDIGFTYEYRNSTSPDSLSKKDNKYKFKLGLSITDIGSISYDDARLTEYNMNSSVNASDFGDKGIEEILEENYEGSESIQETKLKLPTAFHVLLDYNIVKKFYASLNGSFSLIAEDASQASRVINTITLSPRFETKFFSFYLPVSLRQYDGLSAGAGLRLGPLTIGSGSAITNLLSNSTKTTDVYVGIKVPLYQ